MIDSDFGMKIRIRDYRDSDAASLTQIFYRAVESLAGGCYSEREVRAWAPLPIPYPAWQSRLDRHHPWVAETEQCPIGFMSLLPEGVIGLAYVDPAYQRRGVARRLHETIERSARSRDIEVLYVEASHAARPLFEHLGYAVIEYNLVERQGCRLVNWSMRKQIRRHNYTEHEVR